MKKMKKIISIFALMILMFVSSVSATQIYIAEDSSFATIPDTFTNQIYKFERNVLGNETIKVAILENIIFAEPFKTFITVQTLNIDDETHSYRLSANSLTGGVTIVSETFNLTPNSQSLLGVFSTIDNEEVDIFIKCLDCDEAFDPFDVTYTLLEQQPESVNTIFAPLITGVVELIEININLWRIVYYIIITGIIVGFIGSLFFVSFTLFKYGNEMRKGKHRLVNVFDGAGEDKRK